MASLKERWGVESSFQILVIFIVFSVTGSSSLFVARPFIKFIGITKDNLPAVVYWILFILISFIAYQIMLVGFGWLFGQHKFFWNFEKKMIRRLGLGRFLKEE